MAYPVYDTDEYRYFASTSPSGSIYWNTGTVGAGPSADDIEIIAFWFNGTDTLTPPTGFTKVQQIDGTTHTRMICWRRYAPGDTTSGYISTSTINRNRGSLSMIVRGCATSGNPFDSWSTASNNSGTTVNITSATSLGAERLALHITPRYNAAASLAADDATNYSEIFDYSTGTYDYGFSVYSQQIASAGAVAADSFTLATTARWADWLILFKPPATGYANDVNGVAAANIAKVNGVATADIAKVNGVS